ncbi:DKNYY domain-containing protein [Pontibacter litorisediminis]|uniref:DKNYY domain-containing protein n=1 Tax=Pontibacter litorisediminis TaxID=1846260 RepID=UPI003B84816A
MRLFTFAAARQLAKNKNRIINPDSNLLSDCKSERAVVRTYKPLELGFGKDAKHVFHESKLLKGVDPNSFRKVSKFGIEYQDDLGNKFDWEGNRL